MDTQFK